jgi:hypothetical protein
VGGVRARIDFIRAISLSGRADILLVLEAKARHIDEIKELIARSFAGSRIPDVFGVPCERKEDLAGNAREADQAVYGGILALVFDPAIKCYHTHPASDGVVSFEFSRSGSRDFCIIGCYLPHAASTRFHTVQSRLERLALEYATARGKGRRTIIATDANCHLGNGDGHFCVKNDRSPHRQIFLDAMNAMGVRPLHGRWAPGEGRGRLERLLLRLTPRLRLQRPLRLFRARVPRPCQLYIV